MDKRYIEQVALLLRIAPEISRFEEFALHGGSAINLFHHNMPRLSVDIDLTYIPFGERKSDLATISLLIAKLSDRLKKTIPGIRTHTKTQEGEEIKLFCTHDNSTVKVEVNTINRGLLNSTEQLPLCNAAQDQFKGMTNEKFTYQMFLYERDRLINLIISQLTTQQKNMIINVASGQPDWIYGDWSSFPGIAWKLRNIEILKKKNPDKFKSQIRLLEKVLYS